MSKRNRKTLYGVLLAGILFLNLFLTFQFPDDTVNLSESLRLWLEQFGFRSGFHSFRSNAHLVMFFMIGILLGLFCREMGMPWMVILALGCLLGTIDECIKILLPTREFDASDLLRDWIGLGLAVFLLALKGLIKKLHSDY